MTQLGSWLFRSGRFEMSLQSVPLDRALKQQNLFLQRLDALSALGCFNEVVELLQSQRFPLESVLEHMYLAIARTRLNQPVAANNEWQRALQEADNVPKLMAVAQQAERANVFDVAERAFASASAMKPDNRPAAAGRLRVIMLRGNTAEAFAVARQIAHRWPDDQAARNDAHYLGLLLQDPGG